MRRIWTAALAALVLAACADQPETGAPPTTTPRPESRVSVLLTQDRVPGRPTGPLLLGSEPVRGEGCYSFLIDKETFLSVRDGDGQVIGTASVTPGRVAQITGEAWSCWWVTQVTIPEASSYTILLDGEVIEELDTIDRSKGLSIRLDEDQPAPA